MTNEPLSGDNESDLTSDNIPERLFACKYCDKKYVLPKWLDKHISEHGILRFYSQYSYTQSMLANRELILFKMSHLIFRTGW